MTPTRLTVTPAAEKFIRRMVRFSDNNAARLIVGILAVIAAPTLAPGLLGGDLAKFQLPGGQFGRGARDRLGNRL